MLTNYQLISAPSFQAVHMYSSCQYILVSDILMRNSVETNHPPGRDVFQLLAIFTT